jgi:ABC-2 type transport system ATP-binding protein
MEKTLLKIENLSKSYGNFKAVDKLSITIKKGNVYGLLGPNGSGKSTALGMVLNVVNPSEGSFEWYEGKLSTHEALKKIGAIIERPNFYPYMTAIQNLKLICQIKKCSYDNIVAKLELVGLWNRKNSRFSTYSLGMKQRLAIAAALVNSPELLILDEPTNGLDPQGIEQIRKLITLIASMGTTIILASHLLDEVEKVCNKVIVLKNGVKFYEGPTDQITQTHGYFEIGATDSKKLKSYLESIPEVKQLKWTDTFYHVSLNDSLSEEKLSQLLANETIFVTHFIKKQPSLEQEFLTLTQ